MSTTLDYYQVLQIEKDASDQQIKKAYRKLALKFHPDKNSSADAVEKFKDISEAYEILSDPEKRRVYDNRGSNPLHDDDYDYHNPFAGFAFHSPEEIFAEFFNHMSAFGRGGDMFSSFMMPPMHQAPPPPPPFGGFNHPFMMSGFGDTSGFFGHDFMPPMMGSSSFQQQSFIGSSQNSSRGLSNGSGTYSKSVSTTTRNVNGVMESVKITKITDSNGTQVIEEYGNGLTKINGIEQPAPQHQIEASSTSPSHHSSRSVEPIHIVSDSEEEEETNQHEQDELDQYDEHRDYFYRQEQIRQQQLKLQQEQQRLWEEQRRHDEYMRQQRERMHQQHMMLHQQQMMQHMHSPFHYQQQQQQQQQQQHFNRHQQDDLFDNVYGHYPQYNHFL